MRRYVFRLIGSQRTDMYFGLSVYGLAMRRIIYRFIGLSAHFTYWNRIPPQ